MAEYMETETRVVKLGEPITFTSQCKSIFSVGAGIIFHEEGNYLITLKNNHITVQEYELPSIFLQSIFPHKCKFCVGCEVEEDPDNSCPSFILSPTRARRWIEDL